MSIHATAKPLMRIMYNDMPEIYSRFKYVPPSTKIAILRDLEKRMVSKSDTRIIADSILIFNTVEKLLNSSDTPDVVCISTCWMLGALIRYEPLVRDDLSASFRVDIEDRLRLFSLQGSVSLLYLRLAQLSVYNSLQSVMQMPEVVRSAGYALHWITQTSYGMRAVADARILDVTERLGSPDACVRRDASG
ncbi:hypothetical protein DFH09DRAFT_1334882 [Mycena vulgaris]|nr:hypothetical protein DFH09DRAFT_1334882 [Mycena vulgaris]